MSVLVIALIYHQGQAQQSKGTTMLKRMLEERNKEEGFTLIELLVVIIIIGILAAIAIPVFLNQRQNGWDAAVQSDLRNAATAQETYLTQAGIYSAEDVNDAGELGGVGFKYSGAENYDATTGATITVVADAGNTYCMEATSASGTIFQYSSPGGLVANDDAAYSACATPVVP